MRGLAVLCGLASILAAGSSAAIAPDPRAAEATGTLRVLIIRATWGPAPVTENAQSALEESAAFYRRASLGRLDLKLDLTPWLIAYRDETCPTEPTERSMFGRLGELAQDAARSADYDLAAYGRLVYALPSAGCRVGGLGVGREIYLGGAGLFDIHEFGHTFGLPHAGAADCASCPVAEYGDPHSPMGQGGSDFTALEKLKLGWIDRVERVATRGTYRIGAIDQPGEGVKALVVRAAAGEYWVEHRVEAPHVVVRLVVPNAPRHAAYLRSIFLGQADRRYEARGVFRVSAGLADAPERELTFTWTDRTVPTRPRLELPSRVPRDWSPIIRWRTSKDTGSGVLGYRLLVDGRVVEQTTGRLAVLDPLRPGVHRITVEALDRAGNRSRSVRLITVT